MVGKRKSASPDASPRAPGSVRATVSGSFRRAMGAVQASVYRLTDLGVPVLSPADPRVVDRLGDFLFVASDNVRVIKLVQSRHLAAIAASDFLWIVAPEGYLGQSASMEIGYATAVGTPVFGRDVPTDVTLRQYVTIVADELDAVQAATRSRAASVPHVLLDPVAALEAAHRDIELLRAELTGSLGATAPGSIEAAAARLRASVDIPLPRS
jgi:hypothetical protein